MRSTLFTAGKLGLALLLAGLLLLLSLRFLNDRDHWILTSAELPTLAMEWQTQKFTARSSGFAELQLDVSKDVPRNLLDTYIFPTGGRSALDMRWEVRDAAGLVAAGDARDYLYLESQPSLLGRLRRVVMQVPFGRDEVHWNSLGIAGTRTVARGIGRFRLEAGRHYTLDARVSGDTQPLVELAPAVVVRVERRTWEHHYQRVRVIGYLGLASIISGLLILLVSRLRG